MGKSRSLLAPLSSTASPRRTALIDSASWESGLEKKTNEIVAPNIPNRRADIARVLNRGQRSDGSALAVLYRHREHIKCFGSALCEHTFRLRCVHDRGDEGCVDDIGGVLRTRHDDARAVKDRESGEPLIPDESVDGVRYRARRAVFKRRQDRHGETLGKDIGARFKARSKRSLLFVDLIEGKKADNKGYRGNNPARDEE